MLNNVIHVHDLVIYMTLYIFLLTSWLCECAIKTAKYQTERHCGDSTILLMYSTHLYISALSPNETRSPCRKVNKPLKLVRRLVSRVTYTQERVCNYMYRDFEDIWVYRDSVHIQRRKRDFDIMQRCVNQSSIDHSSKHTSLSLSLSFPNSQ